MNPYKDAAWCYREAGWEGILWVPLGAKKPPPPGFTGQSGIWPSGADITEWAEEYPPGSAALRLPENVIGIDVDAYGAKHGRATLAQLEEELGPLPPTWTSTARTDGVSGIRLYRVPPLDPGCGVISGLAGIDLIHYGHRYLMVHPSPHPTEGIYRWWREGAAVDGEIPRPGDLPCLPYTWWQRLTRPRLAVPRNPSDADYATKINWLSNLRPGPACDYILGFMPKALKQLAEPSISRHDLVCRKAWSLISAGAEGHQGIDDALSQLRDAFVDATTDPRRAPVRDVSKAKEEYDALVLSAVGKTLTEAPEPGQGPCSCEPERYYVDVPGVTTTSAAGDSSELRGTSNIVDRRASRVDLPVTAGREPAALWNFIDAAAEGHQVPRAAILMPVLSVLSIASGGRWRIRITPDWQEPLALMTATVMPSGSRKSAAIAAAKEPLLQVERQICARLRPIAAERNALKDVFRARLDELKRKAAKNTELNAEVVAAALALEEMEDVEVPRLVADDATPEALGIRMGKQLGRIGVMSAEGGLFETLAGRYTSGRPNLDVVLKGHAGEMLRIDRASREPITIDDAFLAIGVMIQPGVLEGLGEKREFRSQGLLARFLFGLPENNVGTRPTDATPIPASTAEEYRRRIERLATLGWESREPIVLSLSSEAFGLHRRLRSEIEPRLCPDSGDLAGIADWSSKLPGAVARIAALLTLFSDPNAIEVSAESMRDAISLTDYLISEALAAFNAVDSHRTPSERVLDWLDRARIETFSTRLAHRNLQSQSWVQGSNAVRAALGHLEQLGHIRRVPDTNGRPGRPSERWDVIRTD